MIQRTVLAVIVTAGVLGLCAAAWAADVEKVEKKEAPIDFSVDSLPMQYSLVSGDYKNFQAQQWMDSGYVGGFRNLSLEHHDPNGMSVSMDGGALVGQKDFKGDLLVKKEDAWFVKVDYSQFPKYYSDRGGVYYPFRNLNAPSLNQELVLDIGKVAVEVGLLAGKGMPEVTLEYEHEFKNGSKSMLAWTSVTEGSTSKKIGPAWMHIDETVDNFDIKLKHELLGFTVKGDQHFEIVSSNNILTQRSLSDNLATNTTTESQQLVRVQNMTPSSIMVSTDVGIERWFLDEKVFTSAVYRFVHVYNEEKELLNDFTSAMNPISFSAFAENKYDALADNQLNTNALVLSASVTPWPWLTLIGKARGETFLRAGHSTYPSDIGRAVFANGQVPDGIIDHTEISDSTSRVGKLGELLSVRVKAIPKVAFYGDLELEQVRNSLNETRDSLAGQTKASSGEVFTRETVTDIPQVVWTAGSNFSPWAFLNSTVQFRYRTKDNDYNDVFETFSATQAKSAFFKDYNTHTAEVETRTTVRPCRWAQSSFRYKLRKTNFSSTFEDQVDTVQTQALSNIYTFDTTVTAGKDLSVSGSMTKQCSDVSLPTTTYPTFNSNSDTWMFSTDYHPLKTVSLNNSAYYSRAANFDDFAGASLGAPFFTSGLPLGAAFEKVGIATALRLMPNENVSLTPRYDLYLLHTDQRTSLGGYTAQVISVEATIHWG